MKSNRKPWLVAIVVAILAAAGYYGWQKINGGGLPDGFASGNGRIEATEIDVAALLAIGSILFFFSLRRFRQFLR